MKKLLLLFTFLCITIGLFAKVSKTIDMATAGTLSTVLTSGELNTITELTITGTIDARDFKTMRDLMPVLEAVDIAGTTIVVYSGSEGPASYSYYDANQIPPLAFGSFGFWSGKASLFSVVLPSTVTSIGKEAFMGCIGLTSVTIPTSVTSIDEEAFSQCSSLTSIIIPSTVRGIGFQAFYDCWGPFTVDKENQNYSSFDGILFNKDQTELIICPTSKTGSYIIPSSAISLNSSAFSNCSGLTSVTIPSSITDIGFNAFSGCSGLTSIYALSPIPVDISNSMAVFAGNYQTTCKLYVPLGSKSAYEVADQWKNFTHIVEKGFTGIDPISNEKQLTTYPNPTSGRVKLILDQIPQNGTYLNITDVTGRMILKQIIQNKEEWIDLTGNPPGIYLINTNLGNFKIQKVILK